MYIDGNSIVNSRQNDKGQVDMLQFTPQDLKMINDVANMEDTFHLLVNSICPSIYGHEIVKGIHCNLK